MPVVISMPVFGMSAREGTVQEWLKREGESVAKNEVLLTVETEKAVMEVPSPADGRLARILVQPGETVPVQTPLAEILQPGEEPAAPTAPAPESPARSLPASPSPRVPASSSPAPPLPHSPTPKSPTPESPARLRATPLARKTARLLGIELSGVNGSGPAGRILERDVRASLEGARPDGTPGQPDRAVPVETLVPLNSVRRVTAERMSLSAHSVARVTLLAETDFSEAARFRQQLAAEFERRWQARLTYDAMLAGAAARALAQHPDANAQWADGAVRRLAEINVGVAIQTERGLLVPVIRNADRLSLHALARELARLFDAARSGRISPSDLSGGTFTITNLGGFGVDAFTPIVNPPEAAILGVGRIAARPANVDGQLALRESAVLSLSFDHRVLDGVPAAQFLADLREAIEKPYLLLAD